MRKLTKKRLDIVEANIWLCRLFHTREARVTPGLDPDDIYGPGLVVERMLYLEPGADVTKQRLVDMWACSGLDSGRRRGI